MTILFVSSGTRGSISQIVKSQGVSIYDIKETEIHYYILYYRNISGYIKNIIHFRRFLKNNFFDIIHAHYSLSGFVATLAKAKPLVVSLMGSDVEEFWWSRFLIRIFHPLFWDACIVKSNSLKSKLNLRKNVYVIPNGVNLDLFKPQDKTKSRNDLGWDENKKHILFPANPGRREKNFKLLREGLQRIDNSIRYEVHFLKDIPHEKTPKYFNAADVVVLTSLWEGSPNVIKESMACNTPVVSTDVGDVKWVLGNTVGCYITSFEKEDVAQKILLAIDFAEKQGRTNGRNRIIELGLDSDAIAHKIIAVYEKVLDGKRKNQT